MGCFLMMTERDLSMLKGSMKAAASVVDRGGGQVKVQVSGVGRRSTKQMAALIRNYAKSARVAGKSEVLLRDAKDFGRFAHEAYAADVYHHFGDSETEVTFAVTKPDGSIRNGRVDAIINDHVIIDFKTHDMRNWSKADAIRNAHEFGQQVKEYVEGHNVLYNEQGKNSGWIISTNPPASEEVAQAFRGTLGTHGVRVQFSAGADNASVLQAVEEAVKESS